MIKLARYLKDFKKQVIIGPVFKLLEAVFELIVPLVMSAIIDNGVKKANVGYVYRMGGLMLALGAAGLIFALICQYCAAQASQGVGTNIRNEMFAHINSLSYRELDKLGTNSLITRITNDVNQVQLAVAMLIRLVVRAPFIIFGSLIMTMFIDLRMSLIFAVIIPLVTLAIYLVMSRSVPYYKTRQQNLDEVSLITRENLEGARVIRAFSKQETEKRRFEKASEDVTKTAVKVGNISALLNPVNFAILNCGIVAILWFGGQQVHIGALSQGSIIALVNYTTQISLTLIVVANVVIIFTKAGASAKRINEILDTKPSINDGNKTLDRETDKPIIKFEDVSFSYNENGEYALEDINFTVQKGQIIGIIGGTGSGKSTIVQMIPRFYEASKGSIYVYGKNIKEYQLKELRGLFGIVPQQALLFEGTILENMKWAKADASAEEIDEALEIAQAKDVVESKQNKLNARIVQGGKNLSGGQRQRLTIARALVNNPDILILDDSSSALDYATDANLRKALHKYREDTTVIIVSQRTNAIKHADMIIAMDDGKIMGTGDHQTLYQECETYREICLSQLTEEEVHR